VAVIGGGCAGTLVAANLLRRGGGALRVALIERSASFGPGIAYSTKDPGHLLNVPAERMSAFADQPLHFAAWAARRLGGLGQADYLPRSLYGEYLRGILEESRREAPAGRTLELLGDEVRSLRRAGRGIELELAGGGPMFCDRVVLATGPLRGDPALELPDDPRVVLDPWAPGALEPGAPGSTTLVLGTGLSGIDAMLSLGSAGGRVVAMSRSGRLPHTHLPGLRSPAPPPLVPHSPVSLASLERLLAEHFREMAAIGYDWRDSMDGLRPVTAQLWSTLAPRQRRRFLAERRRAWEASRHRMAPAVGGRLRELLGSGAVEQLAGEVLEVRSDAASLQVTVAVGGSRTVRRLSFDRLVVCTGPGLDVRSCADPLLGSLLDRGLASTDPLGLGLRTSADGALRDPVGRVGGELYTLGALRRGELWETTAVDQIRVQARSLADTIEHSLERRSRARPAHPGAGTGRVALDQTIGLLATSSPKPTEVEQ
jgi:uncharacterized NAD(P)/FAD-binding protein YdhS